MNSWGHFWLLGVLVIVNFLQGTNAIDSASWSALNSRVVGIDLGTTNSLVAVFRQGHVEVIQNSFGDRLTPSMFGCRKLSNGTYSKAIVGANVRDDISVKQPTQAIFSVKRFMGKKFNEGSIKSTIKKMPYSVHQCRSKSEKLCISLFCDGTNEFEGSPEVFSASVLFSLRESAEKYLGYSINRAVIAVPAYFSDSQKKATLSAAAIAGIDVVRMVPEPTAAALAYAYSKKEQSFVTNERVLVVDLGGGTFDLSVLQIKENREFSVLAVSGDIMLGGDDWDALLLEYALEELEVRKGLKLNKEDPRYGALRRQAEILKKRLSFEHEAEFHLDMDTSIIITRSKFEKLTKSLISKIEPLLTSLLSSIQLKKSQIEHILLVGGATRMPRVSQVLNDYFGKPPIHEVNPDEAVAVGAAYLAWQLTSDSNSNLKGKSLGSSPSHQKGVRVFRFQDIIPRNIGISICKGSLQNNRCGYMSTLIKRYSPYPTPLLKRSYTTRYDYQNSIQVEVFEGDDEFVENNILLGFFEVPVRAALKGIPKIEVSMEIDENGVLSVFSRDLSLLQIQTMQTRPSVYFDMKPHEVKIARTNLSSVMAEVPMMKIENIILDGDAALASKHCKEAVAFYENALNEIENHETLKRIKLFVKLWDAAYCMLSTEEKPSDDIACDEDYLKEGSRADRIAGDFFDIKKIARESDIYDVVDLSLWLKLMDLDANSCNGPSLLNQYRLKLSHYAPGLYQSKSLSSSILNLLHLTTSRQKEIENRCATLMTILVNSAYTILQKSEMCKNTKAVGTTTKTKEDL